MKRRNDPESAVVPISNSDTVGDYRLELRYFQVLKRCLVLVRDIADAAALSWDSETTDSFFQDLRGVLARTTIEQTCRPMEKEEAISSLETIYAGLIEIAENLPACKREICH
jgi:hypothetical protein